MAPKYFLITKPSSTVSSSAHSGNFNAMNMNAEGGGSGVGYVDLQHEIKGRGTRASRSTVRVALTTHAILTETPAVFYTVCD